ncbi:MAG: LytR C-terminal domain-containing protein [Marmoricola sp.]
MAPEAGPTPWAGRHKGLLTLGGALLATVVMALWGLSELTTPFPHTATKTCSPADQVVTKTITRPEVTISVYNAGARAGTAGRISAALARLGFRVSTVGNAPDGVTVPAAEVAGPSVTDPATKLVAAALGESTTITSDPSLQIGPGVNVFIGPRHKAVLKNAPREMALPTPTITCLSS